MYGGKSVTSILLVLAIVASCSTNVEAQRRLNIRNIVDSALGLAENFASGGLNIAEDAVNTFVPEQYRDDALGGLETAEESVESAFDTAEEATDSALDSAEEYIDAGLDTARGAVGSGLDVARDAARRWVPRRYQGIVADALNLAEDYAREGIEIAEDVTSNLDFTSDDDDDDDDGEGDAGIFIIGETVDNALDAAEDAAMRALDIASSAVMEARDIASNGVSIGASYANSGLNIARYYARRFVPSGVWTGYVAPAIGLADDAVNSAFNTASEAVQYYIPQVGSNSVGAGMAIGSEAILMDAQNIANDAFEIAVMSIAEESSCGSCWAFGDSLDTDESYIWTARSYVNLGFDFAEYFTERAPIPDNVEEIVSTALDSALVYAMSGLEVAQESIDLFLYRDEFSGVVNEYTEIRSLESGVLWSIEGFAKNGALELIDSNVTGKGETWEMYVSYFNDETWLDTHVQLGLDNESGESDDVRAALLGVTMHHAVPISKMLDYLDLSIRVLQPSNKTIDEAKAEAHDAVNFAWINYYGGGAPCTSPYGTSQTLSKAFDKGDDINQLIAIIIVNSQTAIKDIQSTDDARRVSKQLLGNKFVIMEAINALYLRATIRDASILDMLASAGDFDGARVEQAKAQASLWVIAPLLDEIDPQAARVLLSIFQLSTRYLPETYSPVIGSLTQNLAVNVVETKCETMCIITADDVKPAKDSDSFKSASQGGRC